MNQPLGNGISALEFVTTDAVGFEPMPKPKPGDWLFVHPERGRSFEQYVASAPTTRSGKRQKIVLQPLGEFSPKERKLLMKLCQFCEIFFDCSTRLEQPLPLPDKGRRRNPYTSRLQYHTTVLLYDVLLSKLPEDAICFLGITNQDLYPESSWNYVFGQADLGCRVGVYSLVRYSAHFWGKKESDASRRLMLLRACKVLAHETGHMFSMYHCVNFKCLMSGSNSLDETDSHPVHLCPQCLKKLHHNLKFDILARYGNLQEFYAENGLTEQAQWVKRRLARIEKHTTRQQKIKRTRK